MDHEHWQESQERVRVTVHGHEFDVAYAESGSGDPVTLFLHGIPTWSFLFRDIYEVADHAIVPDFPGYGYTEHLGEGGHDRSIRTMEETVVALLDALDVDRAQVVAHDLGGGAALRVAVNTDRVERLVLSNAVCYDSWPVGFIHELGQPDDAREWARDDVAEKLDYAFGSGTYDDEAATEEFVEGMKAPFLDADPTRLARNAIATNTNHTTELTPHLDDIDAPTLLLWGDEDVLQPSEWGDRLAEDIPDAEKQYLDRAFHWVMQDRPDAYRDALDSFLD